MSVLRDGSRALQRWHACVALAQTRSCVPAGAHSCVSCALRGSIASQPWPCGIQQRLCVSSVLAVVGRIGAKPGMFCVMSTFARVEGPRSRRTITNILACSACLCHVMRRAAAV